MQRNELLKEASALQAVVVGIYRADKFEGQEGNCKRCAKRVRRGRWHDLYECADNDLIDHKAFKRATRIVLAHIPSGIHEASVFWMRYFAESLASRNSRTVHHRSAGLGIGENCCDD